LRKAEDEPVIVEKTYIPVKVLPELNIKTLTGSKYRYVEEYTKKKIAESQQELEAEIATKEVSKLLELTKNSALLKVTNISSLEDGTIFEYCIVYFKTSKYKFIQNVKRGVD